MKIVKETPQKLLGRTRIKAEISHVGKSTPSNKEIKTSLAKAKKAVEDQIIIKHIYTKFGEGNSKIYANIYDSEEDLRKTETKKILKRIDDAKKKAEEAAAKEAEAKVAENQEKKEEVKEEPKEPAKEEVKAEPIKEEPTEAKE
tara:strand:- start:1765 stop:2196 length:432 start_codon:yes stop_codon:yes gene_type:complete